MIRLVAVFVVMVSCTVAGNVLMKQGAMVPAEQRVLLGLMGWRTFFGFGVFLIAGLLYSWLLRSVPLNVAQSFATIQFVSVILAAAVILAEPIPPIRWVGIAFILIGIAIVGLFSFDQT
jgi:undecaprenyl phosphate-alpha-L-ara4N flippase subunit ArnE